jgi:hypothetical protein
MDAVGACLVLGGIIREKILSNTVWRSAVYENIAAYCFSWKTPWIGEAGNLV